MWVVFVSIYLMAAPVDKIAVEYVGAADALVVLLMCEGVADV